MGTTPFDFTLKRSPVLYMVYLYYLGARQDITEEVTPAQAKRCSRKRIDFILKAAQTSLDKSKAQYRV